MLDLAEILMLIPTLGLTLAIIVPLTGILVRFRANYNPKGLQLDAEGGAQPHTGPVVHSYFTMAGRVYRIEVGLYLVNIDCLQTFYFGIGLGWSLQGLKHVSVRLLCWTLYNTTSAVPTLLSTLVVTLFIILFLDTPRSRHGAYRAPETGILVTRHL
jgi:hypothetical protein